MGNSLRTLCVTVVAGCLSGGLFGCSGSGQSQSGPGGSSESSTGSATGSSVSASGSSTGATSGSTSSAASTAGSASSSTGGSSSAGSSGAAATSGSGTTTSAQINGTSTTIGIGSTTSRHLTGSGAGTGGISTSGSGGTTGGVTCATPNNVPGDLPISGTVYGLTEGSVTIVDNTFGPCNSVTVNGSSAPQQTYTLPYALPALTPYNLSFTSTATNSFCNLANNSGVANAAPVTNVEVACCPQQCANVCGADLVANQQVFPDTGWTAAGYYFDCTFCGDSPLSGFPSQDATTGLVQLTPVDNNSETMSFYYYGNAVVMDNFTLTFDFDIIPPPATDQADVGNGFGFFISPTEPTATNVEATDNSGELKVLGHGGMGLSGLGGVGFEWDTFRNTCSDPSTNHIGVDILETCGGLNATGNNDYQPTELVTNGVANTSKEITTELPGVFGVDNLGHKSMGDGVVHHMSITVANDKVSAASVDSNNIPEMVGADLTNGGHANGLVSGHSYFIGFAAANGFQPLYGAFEVGNISIQFPSPACL